MADRIYLMPMVGAGTRVDPRRPRYCDDLFAGCDYTVMDAGHEVPCLVALVLPADPGDAAAIHALLADCDDVVAMPMDLDRPIGIDLGVVVARLELFGIPAGRIRARTSYRAMLRAVASLFQFHQRHQVVGSGPLVGSGVTLATPFAALPAVARQSLREAAGSLGYGTTVLAGGVTLRTCLEAMADQWRAEDVIHLGNERV